MHSIQSIEKEKKRLKNLLFRPIEVVKEETKMLKIFA